MSEKELAEELSKALEQNTKLCKIIFDLTQKLRRASEEYEALAKLIEERSNP